MFYDTLTFTTIVAHLVIIAVSFCFDGLRLNYDWKVEQNPGHSGKPQSSQVTALNSVLKSTVCVCSSSVVVVAAAAVVVVVVVLVSVHAI